MPDAGGNTSTPGGARDFLSVLPKSITPVHTIPPFTLPTGYDHCPDPNCSSYTRTFRPYWRVNEHMRTHHSWPRKFKEPDHQLYPAGSGMPPFDDMHRQCSTDYTSTDGSAGVTIRKRSQGEKENATYPIDCPIDSASTPSTKKRKRSSPIPHRVIKLVNSAAVQARLDMFLSNPDSPLSSAPSSLSTSNTRSIEPVMSVFASSCVIGGQTVRQFAPLSELNKIDHEILPRIHDCVKQHQDVAAIEKPAAIKILQHLLDSDLVRVNKILSDEDAKIMVSVYNILATREEMQGRSWQQQIPQEASPRLSWDAYIQPQMVRLIPNTLSPPISAPPPSCQLKVTNNRPILQPKINKTVASRFNNVATIPNPPAKQLPPQGHFTTAPATSKKSRSPLEKPVSTKIIKGSERSFKPGNKVKLSFKVC